jgi:hypothetical protein
MYYICLSLFSIIAFCIIFDVKKILSALLSILSSTRNRKTALGSVSFSRCQNSPSKANNSTMSSFLKRTEPVFVNLLRRPGIDSQPGGPIRQPYLLYRPAGLHSTQAGGIDSSESIPRLLKTFTNTGSALTKELCRICRLSSSNVMRRLVYVDPTLQ